MTGALFHVRLWWNRIRDEWLYGIPIGYDPECWICRFFRRRPE